MTKASEYLKVVLAVPLARFFLMGAAIFAAYATFEDAPSAPARDEIVLSAERARRLAAQFEATWRRTPSLQELDALIGDWTEEEAFVREARALGLDRDDAVIRQRLRQKMVFFAESGADVAEPDEETLRTHMAAYPERFASPPRIAFEQVFLGPEATGNPMVSAMREALAGGADPATVGTPTLLPASLDLAPASVIESAFGRGFFGRLAALEPGVWEGPVQSALGVHLIRITAQEPARTPPFDAVRDRVERDWRAGRAEAMREAFAAMLLARYRIETPDPAAVLGE